MLWGNSNSPTPPGKVGEPAQKAERRASQTDKPDKVPALAIGYWTERLAQLPKRDFQLLQSEMLCEAGMPPIVATGSAF